MGIDAHCIYPQQKRLRLAEAHSESLHESVEIFTNIEMSFVDEDICCGIFEVTPDIRASCILITPLRNPGGKELTSKRRIPCSG
jgi:hypothetical protein